MAFLRWIGLIPLVFVIGCGPKEYDTPLATEGVDTRIDESSCQTDIQFVANQVWPRILSQCTACHNAQGLAANTDYVLQNLRSEAQDHIDVSQTYEDQNPGLILNKAMALGVTHGGGSLITEGSDNHDLLTQFIDRFENPITECDDTSIPTSTLDARALSTRLQLFPPTDTYRQASILLAGELPSDAELAAITDSNLKPSIRSLMAGVNFERFLMEAANDQLLTLKWASDRTPGLAALNGEHFYPQISSRIQPLEDTLQAAIDASASQETISAAQQAVWNARRYSNVALAEEPLRLISHVVQNERHYGEVLTADYIMVNPYSNDIFAAGASFTDNLDPDEWKPASISSGYRNRTDSLPHAGILSSPMFLARYPSTDTNRNRARARWTYYFFLGVDIEGLATRPMNSDSLMDVDNPTLNNPDCAVCHVLMDPVAGTFQNWGNDGQFRDQCGWSAIEEEWVCDRDALPWTGYKEFGSPYQEGDLWYRDMRALGLANNVMPASENNNSLRWLSQQIVADTRFSEGTVRFWFKGLFGREPLPLPTNSSAADFNERLAAHELDKIFISDFATAFENGTAGTAQNGSHNVKDLLLDMLMSPLFRAQAITTELSSAENTALYQIGSGRLLTPEQLNRKLIALTGRIWQGTWSTEQNQLIENFYGFYGGIDSDGVTDRSEEMNALMATVIERYSNEMVCSIVIEEFEADDQDRLLFPGLTADDIPDATGESKIKNTLEHLISRLWSENDATTTEVNAAYDLFVDLRNERINNNATIYLSTNADSEANDDHDEFCILDWETPGITNDSNQVLRPWMGVLSYLLSDYRVLYL